MNAPESGTPEPPTAPAERGSRPWVQIIVALLAGIVVGALAMRMARPPVDEPPAPATSPAPASPAV